MRTEERLLHLGSLLVWAGVPLACSTRLADAVEVPKSSCFTIGALLVSFAWLLGASRGTWPWLRPGRVTGLWVAFYAWWTASALWGLGGLSGQIFTFEHALSLMLLLAWTATGTPERWRVWWWMILVAGLLVALYAWIQRAGLDFMGWDHPEFSVIRTISTLGNPNYLAFFLVAWLPLSLPLVLPRRWLWIPWLMVFGALIQTGTRGAWLACLVSLIVAFARRPGKAILAVAASMLLVAVAVVALGAQVLSERTQASNMGDENMTARIFLWRAALGIMVTHPFGVGPGGYTMEALHYRQYEPMEKRDQGRLPEHPHNQLLSVGTDAGWPGVALLLAGLALYVRERWKRARTDLTELALLLTVTAMAVHLLTISFALPGEVLWLAALSWPGQFDPPASRRPPSIMVLLSGLVWLGGTVVALGWVEGERDLWWGDEYRLRGLTSGQMVEIERAVGYYGQAAGLVQPQRRLLVATQLGSLYNEVALRLNDDPNLRAASLSAYTLAARLDPRNPYPVANMAGIVQRQKGSGEELFRVALRMDPRNPGFWALLGDDQLKQGKLAEAEQSYRRSLELYPAHAGTLYRHGEVLVRLGQTQEGRRQMDEARRLDPRIH